MKSAKYIFSCIVGLLEIFFALLVISYPIILLFVWAAEHGK